MKKGSFKKTYNKTTSCNRKDSGNKLKKGEAEEVES
jgi:hypothetical protein